MLIRVLRSQLRQLNRFWSRASELWTHTHLWTSWSFFALFLCHVSQCQDILSCLLQWPHQTPTSATRNTLMSVQGFRTIRVNMLCNVNAGI